MHCEEYIDMMYEEILSKTQKEIPDLLVSLDPGETTGWAMFKDGLLTDSGQIPTLTCRAELMSLIEIAYPDVLVCENYRIYEHKLKRHANQEVYTLRLIGAIDYVCTHHQIPIVYQMASLAKGFVTDNKLKSWGMWKRGQRHARDAIRHGIYYLLCGKRQED